MNWLKNNTVFLTLHGSQAYGLANDLSDVDVKGICVPPRTVENDLFHRFEQAENNPDVAENYAHWKNPKNPKFESVIYSLRKFFLLASKVNPNIIELLFTDESSWLERSWISDLLIENRNAFLSTKAKFTFSGYAFAQVAKIERHRKWIVMGELKEPTREEFELPPIRPSGIEEVFGYIKSKVEQWNFNQFELEESDRADMKELIWELVAHLSNKHVSWDNWPDAYAGGVIHKMQTDLSLKEDVIRLINQERAYFKAKNTYQSWLRWKKERNPERRKLEVNCGYDCYSGDTEFLTNDGWKIFDEISPTSELATVNPKTHRIEYQRYIDKFDGRFNGELYHFTGTHTDILVTPNHKMWVRSRERNTKVLHDWRFVEASHLPSGFNVLRIINPLHRNFKNEELPISYCSALTACKRLNLLKLIGWYVSEGCALYSGDRIKGISISQLKGGRVHNHIAKCRSTDAALQSIMCEYSHFRETKQRWEMTWNVYGKHVGTWFEENCGRYSENKKLPRWVMSLSKREKITILDAMMAGDGTTRPKDGAEIYYTSSISLANDTQELAFLCGFETSLWGPYDGMYQVHINRCRTESKEMTRKSISKISVTDHRIVCFTVPNHLLITRRYGKIAIQGNSKHASHLVRLMRMGYEILTEGKVIVKRPDAEELLAIKNGAWTYERVMEYKEELQRKLDEAYQKIEADRKAGLPVLLPREVDYVKLNSFYHELTESYLSKMEK